MRRRGLSTAAMAAGVLALLVVAGGASYFVGVSNAGTTASTATNTITQQASTVTQTAAPVTITQSVTQISTLVSTQTSTSTLTTTAAPVSFAFFPQPSNLNMSLVPSSVKIRFLQYSDPMGIMLHAALWEPQTGQAKVAVILIPGTAGNYTSVPKTFGQAGLGYVAIGLSTRGYAVFETETRAGVTPRTDSAYDVPFDINAAVQVVKSFGYANIVLAGFSLGGQSIVQYAAVFRDPAVKGLVLNGAVANGPWRAKDGLANCAAGTYQSGSGCTLPAGLYALMYNESKALIAQGNPTALLPQKVPLAPWNGAPAAYASWSAIYFYTYFGPDGIVTNNIIRAVTVPVITIRDQADSQNRAFENAWLVGNATAPGTLIPSFQNVLMPNSHAPYATAHTFDVKANGPLLISTVDTWIKGLNLK